VLLAAGCCRQLFLLFVLFLRPISINYSLPRSIVSSAAREKMNGRRKKEKPRLYFALLEIEQEIEDKHEKQSRPVFVVISLDIAARFSAIAGLSRF
jgi:hypothetical protein